MRLPGLAVGEPGEHPGQLPHAVLALCEAGNAALGGQTLLSGVLDTAGKLAVVAAIGVAVLRYRLVDVDLAISRTLAYGWLAVVVTAVYVVLVVGVGSAIGRPAGPDLWLSLLATVVVALVSLPLRSRLQELANRLVFGRRQAPYESLAGFTRGLADRYAVELGDFFDAADAAGGPPVDTVISNPPYIPAPDSDLLMP